MYHGSLEKVCFQEKRRVKYSQKMKYKEDKKNTAVFGNEESFDDLLRTVLGHGASLVTQLVKNLPAMPEIWVGSLGWEDPLERGKATHSSILAWRIPGTV